MAKTSTLIAASCEDIKKLGLSYPYSQSRGHCCDWKWKPEETSAFLAVIGSAIGYLKQSEFHLVQRGWPDTVCDMDDMLVMFQKWIQDPNKSIRAPLQIPYIQLAQSLLPMIKLIRLFFNKLSAYGKETFPIFTEIHLDQLESIQKLPRKILHWLRKLLKQFNFAAKHPRPEPLHARTVTSLKDCLEPSLLIISHHFILLTSTPNSLAAQNSFMNWYINWCKQFNVAMHNSRRAIGS
ncbi:hypothetical protein PCANC_12892 [Puccinia coronata f. sp. avenae]|uniref:Uncharacterized protein n=1 Tax=Puccinia coronata f. sp. avenae TaxID=200324 RepID=A0A2N5VE66_9BASI|nr:hypothetical protein PCANC_12892 [Puccinia coronata f. sp. avenae]